jgi:hypothetical protein
MVNNLRQEIIQVLVATQGESEGVTADAILCLIAPAAPESQKPQPGIPVLARYFNDQNNQRIVKAVFIPKYFMEDDGESDLDSDYLEANDNYYWPQGWYEVSENHEPDYMLMHDKVIDWMPMPVFPPHEPEVGQ